MPVDYRAPNINARRLGLYLRRTREFLELSYTEAAARVRCESEWLVRVETGFESPSPAEVERILERYQVREAKVAEVMIDLASRPHGPEWLEAHADRLTASKRDALIMESEASVIHSYGVQLVPYMARVESYARHLAPHLAPGCDVDVEWDLLNSRQRYRAGGRRRVLDVIIDERALTLPLTEPGVMAAQLRHLLDLGVSPDTTIRVVPSGAVFFEARACPFDVLEFPEIGDRLTLTHTALGTEFGYGDLTDTWILIEEKSAISPDDSRNLIHRLLAELTAP
ncbi:helix-turn-helix domain-containing protein [Actinomadura alba]|uniref:Helix-turn-helix domain-containing protein n=1 Tax=Actinomadura alba TaxID=406431 RepID=A0ABR7LLX9_9ACTN|nr:helix-turn-helix transcriptional regulator [Actinomadura alba]MBC6465860.1 helix-turn-helix domain-containing protein [Actinomadura alba]